MDERLEQEILKCITPEYQRMFHSVIENAIFRYEKMISSDDSIEFKKRTQANIINDFICENVNREAEKYPHGELHAYYRHSALRLSIANGKIVARFKKMNSTGVTSNITTQQVLNFENQINLFDDRPKIHINVGYVYNGLDCKMMLSHPKGIGVVDWTYPLEAQAVDNVTTLSKSQTSTLVSSDGQTAARNPKVRKGIRKDDVQNR